MSAATTISVRVVKYKTEEITVSAVTLDEAKSIALQMPDVFSVIEAWYPDAEEEPSE